MSIMKLPLVLERIKAATPASPIVVFRCDKPEQLNAVFNTWTTQIDIAEKAKDYIGTFHKDHDIKAVRQRLEAELYK